MSLFKEILVVPDGAILAPEISLHRKYRLSCCTWPASLNLDGSMVAVE